MKAADLAILKAISRLENDRDWQVFAAWLEEAAAEAVDCLLKAVPTEQLPEMRREAALLRELLETIKTASDTVRSADEISQGRPHFGGSLVGEGEHP